MTKKIKDRINLNVPKQFVKQRRTAIIVSFCNVIVLLFLSYILNNQAIFTGEDLNKYAWMELVKERLDLSKGIEKSNEAVFVNVAYDKQLIERYDGYGMNVGNADITDRAKLRSFLEVLQKTNTFKYIFLDVRFEKGFDSSEESAAGHSPEQTFSFSQRSKFDPKR